METRLVVTSLLKNWRKEYSDGGNVAKIRLPKEANMNEETQKTLVTDEHARVHQLPDAEEPPQPRDLIRGKGPLGDMPDDPLLPEQKA